MKGEAYCGDCAGDVSGSVLCHECLTEVEGALADMRTLRTAAEKERDVARAEVMALRAALGEVLTYTPHHWSCQKPRDPGDDCNCQRGRAEAALAGVKG